MDAEAAIALFDQLEADGEPLDDLSEFDDLGSSDEDGLSSGEEELLDNNLLGGGDSSDTDSDDDAHASAGLEKSGRLVAICDQKIFLATRSQAAVVNLATNFSTKGPVWRPQFGARFHVRTNGTVRRPENERQVSENEIQNFENLSRY